MTDQGNEKKSDTWTYYTGQEQQQQQQQQIEMQEISKIFFVCCFFPMSWAWSCGTCAFYRRYTYTAIWFARGTVFFCWFWVHEANNKIFFHVTEVDNNDANQKKENAVTGKKKETRQRKNEGEQAKMSRTERRKRERERDISSRGRNKNQIRWTQDTKCDIKLIGEKQPMNCDLNTCNYYCWFVQSTINVNYWNTTQHTHTPRYNTCSYGITM